MCSCPLTRRSQCVCRASSPALACSDAFGTIALPVRRPSRQHARALLPTTPPPRATDDVDGTVAVVRTLPQGQPPLDTRVPRALDAPYLITYLAADSAGNRQLAFRRVLVACPAGERRCEPSETADGVAACSEEGICGVAQVPTTTTSKTTSTRSSGSSRSSSTASSSSSSFNTPPVLTLQGEPLVAFTAGPDAAYLPCTPRSAITDLCDPGALAQDAEDGAITPLVRACGAVFAGAGGGLSACGVKPRVAGEYPITFTVVDTGGLAATVVRLVRVCPPEEVVCGDLTCSVGECGFGGETKAGVGERLGIQGAGQYGRRLRVTHCHAWSQSWSTIQGGLLQQQR